MAGKKSRKRQSAKKKTAKEDTNKTNASVEEKKPKLIDKLDEQSPDKPEPNILGNTDDNTNNDHDSVGSLQEGENKYVPPFTRKGKRVLKRSGCPVSPAARPKRSWRGVVKNSEQAQPGESLPDVHDKQTDDLEVCTNGSPKIEQEEKKHEEEEIDVVRIDEQITCSQEDSISSIKSIKTAGIIEVQEDTLTIVTHILNDILDAICKRHQLGGSVRLEECEKDIKESREEERDVYSEANNRSYSFDNDANKFDEEVVSACEEVSETGMGIAIESTSPTKTALQTTTSGEVVIESMAKYIPSNGSALATTTTTVNRDVSSSETALETAKSEDPLRECDTESIDHADETLQSCKKVEKLSTLHEVDNGRRKESDSDSISCNLNYVQEKEKMETRHTETENAAITNPHVKLVVLLSNTTTAETVGFSTTAVHSMDTELRSSELHPADYTHEKENLLNSRSNGLSKTAEHTEMSSETNVDMLTSEEVPGSEICGDDVNYLCPLNKCQGLDQMVPAYYDPTTVLSQENPNGKELLREPDQNGMDECSVNGANMHLKTPSPIENQENQTHEVEEKDSHSQTPQAVHSTGEIEGSHHPIAQAFVTEQASEVMYMDQEPSTHGKITMDETTSVEASIQDHSTCKQVMQGISAPGSCKLIEGENNSTLPSSEVAPGCSSFGSDGDLLEFDCLMDCTDSQLVSLDSSSTSQPPYQKLDSRQLNNIKGVESSTSKADQCSMDVPCDSGMIKGLISELSALNKFIMGAWKDLENQKKQRQARIKSGKGKKLK